MANVFYINKENKDENNNQLASVAYVNATVKKLQDAIFKIIYEKTQIPKKINFSDNKIIKPIPERTPQIKAENVITDSNHKFISEIELDALKNKPTNYEVQKYIEDLQKNIMKEINKRFDDILNSKDSLNTIKFIINEIKKNNGSNLNIESSINDDLNQHVKSNLHLTNDDREALDLLIKFINKGCADWNATKDDPNYIRNKPESLPANGGDADTIEGYPLPFLLNNQFEDYIIGLANSVDYKKEELNICINDEEESIDFFDNIGNCKCYYSFKSGSYRLPEINLKTTDSDSIIFKGQYNNTIFISNESITVGNNVIFEDLTIEYTKVIIRNKCKFNNVTFRNCIIDFSNSVECTINGCEFNNTSISFFGNCISNMIINCRFKNCKLPVYIGGNNLFNNNLSC